MRDFKNYLIGRPFLCYGLVTSAIALVLGCVARKFQVNEPTSQTAGTATEGGQKTTLQNRVGPVTLSESKLEALSLEAETASLIKDYAQAVSNFRSAYGETADPYQVVILRASRFLDRKGWDRSKVSGNYNPITLTDKYNYERENGVCRIPNQQGVPTNVWIAFERASEYVNRLQTSFASQSSAPWSESYLRMPHVKSWHASHSLPLKGQSQGFDPDILLSIHAAAGEGATQNSSSCGKLGQLKVCDGHRYSPFFDPNYRPTSCQVPGGWFPNAKDWQALQSAEMKHLGQWIIPLDSGVKDPKYVPEGYKNACGSSQAVSYEKDLRYGKTAAKNDWPGLKDTLPKYAAARLSQSAGVLANESASGKTAAFALYASVEQVWKDIFNYRLKPGMISSDPKCKPCGLVRNSFGKMEWDESSRGQCPNTCFKSDVHLERTDASAKGTDILRAFFVPDTSDVGYRSIASLINNHFARLSKGISLAEDPISIAAEIQQWMAALHPFIDGVGRTSRFLSEMILHSVGLPFPSLQDFWLDTTSSKAEYREIFKEGVYRHTATLNACAKYVACKKNQNANFSLSSICVSAASDSCSSHLSFSYGSGKSDKIDPCDCSVTWEKDPQKAKFASCK